MLFLLFVALPAFAGFTKTERDWLHEHGDIKFASTENYVLRFEFSDKLGKSRGMAVDLIRWIGDYAGFNETIYHMPLKEAREVVQTGTYDVVPCLFYSEERSLQFSFTEPVFVVPASIFVSESCRDIYSIDDLAGKTVAVPETDFAEEFLRKKGVGCEFVMTSDFKQAVDALAAGKVDAIVGDEQTVYYYLFEGNLGNRIKKTGDVLYEGRCCMAVRKDHPVLLSILSKGIAAAQEQGVIERIEQEWLGLENTSIGIQIVRYSRYVILGVSILLLAVLLFWLWDVRLTRHIQIKTKQLRNSEERLRTIFQHSPDAIFIEDEKGIVVDANPMACSFHGRTHDEMVGTSVFDLVPECCREDVKREFPKWFTGELKRYEGVSFSGDGLEVPVEVIGAPLRYEGKNAVLLLVRDMTERNRSERALKESEMRYRGLVETQNSLILRMDTEGRLTFVNEAFCRFMGRSRGELIGGLFHPFVYYEDLDRTKQSLEELSSSGEKSVVTEQRICAKSYVAWVRWEATSVFDESGQVAEIQIVGQDVTESRRVQDALQESEKRLRFLFEEIPHIAVQGYNSDHEIIFWNRASERLYNYPREDALGKKIEDLLAPPGQRETIAEAIDTWVETGRLLPSEEMMKRRSDDKLVSVYSSRLATWNKHGEREMYVIDIDLSEIKRASEELVKAKEHAERASRAKSEFLANMSHEIRTPMNGVMGMTSLLLDTSLDAEQNDLVQTMMESTQELLTIIDELLDISRIEAGEVRLQMEPFSPRESIEKVINLFSERALKKDISLSVAVCPDVPQKMMGDAGRIRQVLINLVGNALKFTHGGHVQIRARVEKIDNGWNMLLDVKDTGVGMTPELQERVFDKFTQGDTSSTREHGGAGLGLAISKQLVELMGGTISVSSTLGEGTVFNFNIILPEMEQRPEVSAVSVQEKSAELSADILLVEDNLVNQKVATAMIKKFGCNVTVAANGAEALKVIPDQRFDLIFMDCQMPIMDGFETTRAIRQMVGEIRDIPIVAMTAHALKEDRQKCLDVGMDDYLAKPVHREKLFAILQKYCGQQKTA